MGWKTIKIVATIIKEVGLLGFIVAFCSTVFIIWGDSTQKQEFIDLWILLKRDGGEYGDFRCIIIIVSLLVALVLVFAFYKRILKSRKEENNRIGAEKTELQKLLLNRDLPSSDSND